MASKSDDLHMLFFPLMAPGHMLPLIDMAKLFAARGARVTILTTLNNATALRPTLPSSIHLHPIPFPFAEFDLPENCDINPASLPDHLGINFFKAVASLNLPFDAALHQLLPDCVVSDMFLPWTHHLATALSIPRIVFHGTSNFALSLMDAYDLLPPQFSDAESIILPNLPHPIQLHRSQVLDMRKLVGTPMEMLLEMQRERKEVEPKSYGSVMNSFYELEPEYVKHYREAIGMRSWNIGPVSLQNQDFNSMITRGGENPLGSSEILEWLDGRSPESVVYVCFGSGGVSSAAQLGEIAKGLEASGHPFIWAVKDGGGDDWGLEGFEERVGGRGLVVRGWAPQLLILNHGSVGGFVTHCGWNSSLEGISAGVPMATWPMHAEQFYNEKFLVEIVKVGVMVGSMGLSFGKEERPIVKADAVEMAVRRLMGDEEEAMERRRRAKELGEKARRAVEKGGSSFEDVEKLMHDLIVDRRKSSISGLC